VKKERKGHFGEIGLKSGHHCPN